MHLLLRTILERPDLATHIKHVDFRSSSLQHKRSIPKPSLTINDDEYISRFVQYSNLPLKDVIIEGIRRRNGSVFVSLLLSQLENIKSLSLIGVFWLDNKLMGALFEGKSGLIIFIVSPRLFKEPQYIKGPGKSHSSVP